MSEIEEHIMVYACFGVVAALVIGFFVMRKGA